MTLPNDPDRTQPTHNPTKPSFSWAERKSVQHDSYVDSWLESFAELPPLIPPTSLFTQVRTLDGRFYGYVHGCLPAAGSWFTFPLHFLCNESVPGSFFAAGIGVGPQGNVEWLSLAIRAGMRALWVRATTSNMHGGSYGDEAHAILADALARWNAGEEIVVAGIHADRLPTPLPSPLFADQIDGDSERFLPIPFRQPPSDRSG